MHDNRNSVSLSLGSTDTYPGAKIPRGCGGCDPPTEKTRQFAGQLNPFAGHKLSLTVAHSAHQCCHGACEAPGKIVKHQVKLQYTSFFAGQFPVSQGKSL